MPGQTMPVISSSSKNKTEVAEPQQIAEALALVEEVLRDGPGPFAAEAAIASLP
jgi:hypothetical protein